MILRLMEDMNYFKIYNQWNGKLYCHLIWFQYWLPSNCKRYLDETRLVCDHLTECYWAVLSCGTIYYAVQGASNF